jgi:hypothetical protein
MDNHIQKKVSKMTRVDGDGEYDGDNEKDIKIRSEFDKKIDNNIRIRTVNNMRTVMNIRIRTVNMMRTVMNIRIRTVNMTRTVMRTSENGSVDDMVSDVHIGTKIVKR